MFQALLSINSDFFSCISKNYGMIFLVCLPFFRSSVRGRLLVLLLLRPDNKPKEQPSRWPLLTRTSNQSFSLSIS